jgi:sarcosine oxidase subunit alpha
VPVPILDADPARESVELSFDGRALQGRAGDTVAMALIGAEILMTSRSAKYRRPRGGYCLSGDCGTCLVRIDERPNMRGCTIAVRPGMKVASQNTWQPSALDPTALFDWAFPRGFDHHHFMVRPRVMNQLMQGFARNLTGFGEIPGEKQAPEVDVVVERPHVFVVGGGAAGTAASERLRAAGVDCLVAERREPTGVAVFGFYPEHQAFAGTSKPEPGRERLHVIRPARTLLCTGAREPTIPLPNNDLPGVFAARGLLRQLAASGRRIAGALVVIGEGHHAEDCFARLRALVRDDAPPPRLFAPSDVRGFVGRSRVVAVATREGRFEADIVALAPAPAPAHELAAQCGAELSFDGSGFAPRRDTDGRLAGKKARAGVFAAGDLCGFVGPEAAARDGARVASAIESDLGAAHE